MIFEPHLPDYSCTLRVKLGEGALEDDAHRHARNAVARA